ncbi:hypothetical protein OESDEN_06084, partial [Oesophagostomum dentatum]
SFRAAASRPRRVHEAVFLAAPAAHRTIFHGASSIFVFCLLSGRGSISQGLNATCMDQPGPSSSAKNFSTIARRLLLTRQPPKSSETPVLLLPVAGTKLPTETVSTVLFDNKQDDIKPFMGEEPDDQGLPDFSEEFSSNGCLDHFCPRPRSREKPVPYQQDPICEKIHNIDTDRLMELHAKEVDDSNLSKRSEAIIRQVHMFFEEFKKELGETCSGTVFDSTADLTAWACGVTPETVGKVEMEDECELLPPPRKKKKNLPKILLNRELVVEKYEAQWGEKIRDYIRNKMSRDSDMTVNRLYDELCSEFKDFNMAKTTLHTFLKGMGVKFDRMGTKYQMII